MQKSNQELQGTEKQMSDTMAELSEVKNTLKAKEELIQSNSKQFKQQLGASHNKISEFF